MPKNLYFGKNKFSEKTILEHQNIFGQAVKIGADWEFKTNSETLKSENVPENEKQEVMRKNTEYKDKKIGEINESFRKLDVKTGNELESYCDQVFDSLKKYVVRIRTSSLNSRDYDREAGFIIDKFYEMRVMFRRETTKLVENYESLLVKYDNDVYKKYLDENSKYEKSIQDTISNVKSLEQGIEQTVEETNDVKKLPENPFELPNDYKQKVVDVGKKPVETPNDEKEDNPLNLDDFV